ncbi:alpha/beta hydrolase [Methylobacterium haplocladii]|uniref:Esterase n=1 Tax=Methylobacterium haplocladii TaxID=1176176 RepID=A0A512IJE8_9HYPH|nr:alpha/beta hydrolase [Methylobacterium haplocladii]GEO97804.1 esterase [Methylobacterium haplocladii]GJD82650.1 Carboxylesterase NlhH [Methylobacterium haplocladii]GLS57563.1 esterase [Methylobacterium haplocladii]
MSLDPYVRRFLDTLAMGGAGAPSVAGRRQGQRVLARLAGVESAPISVRELTLPLWSGPCAARLYTPPDAAEPGPGLVFFHGGGLIAGDLDTHDTLCRRLAVAVGCRLVSVAYRLAPEHPYPAAIEDAVAAFVHVAGDAAAFGIDPSRLAIGGDSAGAGLAARVCQELRGNGLAIAAQLLLCPVLDLRCGSAAQDAFATGYFLDGQTMRHDIAANGVAHMVDEPRVSPLLEPDLAGLPPAQIHTAAFDIVRDDGAAYAERLRQAGIPVAYTCHAGMIHFFYGLGRLIPAAQPILTEIGAAFGALLRGAPAEQPDIVHPEPLRRAS